MPRSTNESLVLNRIAAGHSMGKLQGLACHPLREEFATCGDDKVNISSYYYYITLSLFYPSPTPLVVFHPCFSYLSFDLLRPFVYGAFDAKNSLHCGSYLTQLARSHITPGVMYSLLVCLQELSLSLRPTLHLFEFTIRLQIQSK